MAAAVIKESKEEQNATEAEDGKTVKKNVVKKNEAVKKKSTTEKIDEKEAKEKVEEGFFDMIINWFWSLFGEEEENRKTEKTTTTGRPPPELTKFLETFYR